ncbi:MAG: hypothetical protein UR18_C0006G0012 [Candidatus Nomurabacteria bacterium GW2011_GWE2_31_40]|nr:MAG: hypothetical protein UR18_C0006G0012 [Candidatus Nomurabacteria bacterium GW2011_GWE2_31_40]
MMMKTKDIYMYVLGIIVVLAVLTIVAALIFVPIPSMNKDILNIVLGALLAQFANIIQYFFGSSQGSKDKGDLINQMKSTNAGAQ